MPNILSLVLAIIWFMFTTACTGESNYSAFKERVEAGGTCEELFNLRNSFDLTSPDLPAINEELFNLGCDSNNSVRTS